MEVASAPAGDIVAVAKLQFTETGDTLCDKANPVKFAPIAFPQATYFIAIEAADKNDEDKMGTGLNRLREEDPSFVVDRNVETHQTLIGGQGDKQINIVLAKMKDRFGVNVKTVPQKIAYRETIKGTSDVEGKHKKQSGGAGQFGDVFIKFSPSTEDFEFAEEIFGGSGLQRTSNLQRRSSADQFLRTTSLQSRRDSRNAWRRDLLQAARYRASRLYCMMVNITL